MPRVGFGRFSHALLVVLVAGTLCAASDQPVPGTDVALRTSPGSLRLLLQDPSIPVPAVDDANDPSVVGMTVTLFGRTSGVHASFTTTPGRGPRAWTSRSMRGGSVHRYRDASADGSGLRIRSVELRPGGRLRVTARAAGLALDPAEEAVAIRVEYGSVRACAVFDGPSVRRSRSGQFVARNAPVGALASCDDDVLAGNCPLSGCPSGSQTRFCGDGPVTDACSIALPTEAACGQEGGCWQRTPFHPDGTCNCPTRDSGRWCVAYSDCEGLCLAPTEGSCESRVSGLCSETRTLYSCVCLAATPGDFYWLCID